MTTRDFSSNFEEVTLPGVDEGEILVIRSTRRKKSRFDNLPAVVEQQKPESSPWVVPVGAIAFGTAVSLVAD